MKGIMSGGRQRHAPIDFVTDRLGHDPRDAIDASAIALGRLAEKDLASGLKETIRCFIDEIDWWRLIRADRREGRRLGAPGAKQ